MGESKGNNPSILDQLRNSPSINQLHQILKSLINLSPASDSELNEKSSLSASANGADQLGIYSTLLNQTIPDLYHDLPSKTLLLLHQYLLSVSAIGTLIGRINTLSKTQDSNFDKIVGSHIDLLATVLSNVLVSMEQESINKLWENISIGEFSASQKRIYYRTLISMFAGGKILSTMTEARLGIQQMERRSISISEFDLEKWEWLTSGRKWMKYLSHQLVPVFSRGGVNDKETSLITEFLKKTLSLDSNKIFFETTLKEEYIGSLIKLVNYFSAIELQQFLISYLLPYLQAQKLAIGVDSSPTISDRVNATANLIGCFLKSDNIKIHAALLKQAESTGINLQLKRAIVLVCCRNEKTKEELFKELMMKWGNEITVKHSPVLIQEAQTQLLILFVPHLTTQYLTNISTSSHIYLKGISNHLESFSARPRLYGMAIGEIISEKADRVIKPLNFDIDSTNYQNEEYKFLKSDLLNLNDKYQFIQIGEIFSLLDAPLTDNNQIQEHIDSEEESEEEDFSTEFQSRIHPRLVEIEESDDDNANIESLKAVSSIYDSDDSDDDEEFQPFAFPENDIVDSDDDDDPSVAKKKRITAPVYIPTMIEYLNDTDSYEKQKIALEVAPALIIRKAKFGQELSFYSKSLGNCLAMLKDTFEIDNFQSLRLRALIALVSSCPTVVPEYFAELIVSGDLTLQDRMSLLSAISLGARALSGETDDISAQPKVDFTSKKLPDKLHKLFVTDVDNKHIRDDNEVDMITKQLQRQLLKETIEEAKDHEMLSGPKILRMSSKLQKVRAGDTSSQTRYFTNNYAKLAGRNFFFPLTGRWWSIGGGKAFAQYSEMFQAHYVKTLAILLHAAYPSSLELPEMASEILDIVLSQRSVKETQVIESLITSILVVLEILEPEFIVKRYPKELVELRNWLEGMWEGIIDERVKGMAAGTLYKIVHITEKWERLLIEEFMGLENTVLN